MLLTATPLFELSHLSCSDSDSSEDEAAVLCFVSLSDLAFDPHHVLLHVRACRAHGFYYCAQPSSALALSRAKFLRTRMREHVHALARAPVYGHRSGPLHRVPHRRPPVCFIWVAALREVRVQGQLTVHSHAQHAHARTRMHTHTHVP